MEIAAIRKKGCAIPFGFDAIALHHLRMITQMKESVSSGKNTTGMCYKYRKLRLSPGVLKAKKRCRIFNSKSECLGIRMKRKQVANELEEKVQRVKKRESERATRKEQKAHLIAEKVERAKRRRLLEEHLELLGLSLMKGKGKTKISDLKPYLKDLGENGKNISWAADLVKTRAKKH